jgi:hypothetical protein
MENGTMKLNSHSDRDMLKMRIQVYAHGNIQIGKIKAAEVIANGCLSRYDDMIEHNPTNSKGYWANYYYDEFVRLN